MKNNVILDKVVEYVFSKILKAEPYLDNPVVSKILDKSFDLMHEGYESSFREIAKYVARNRGALDCAKFAVFVLYNIGESKFFDFLRIIDFKKIDVGVFNSYICFALEKNFSSHRRKLVASLNYPMYLGITGISGIKFVESCFNKGFSYLLTNFFIMFDLNRFSEGEIFRICELLTYCNFRDKFLICSKILGLSGGDRYVGSFVGKDFVDFYKYVGCELNYDSRITANMSKCLVGEDLEIFEEYVYDGLNCRNLLGYFEHGCNLDKDRAMKFMLESGSSLYIKSFIDLFSEYETLIIYM